MRVLLATDRPDLGHALSLFLSERSIKVIDVVADLGGLMDRAAASRPDVVLVDWCLGDAVSRRMVEDLMDRDDPTPVIILTTAQDRPRAHGLRCGGLCDVRRHAGLAGGRAARGEPGPSAGAGTRAD